MPATPHLSSPLTIHIVWHPEFKEGDAYARFLYGMLNRDPADPFDRGIGIPVFFRSVPTATGLPLPINLGEADRNVIILLLDDELVVRGGEIWEQYVVKILADCRAHGPLNQLIPVAISQHGFGFNAEVANLNGSRLFLIKAVGEASGQGGQGAVTVSHREGEPANGASGARVNVSVHVESATTIPSATEEEKQAEVLERRCAQLRSDLLNELTRLMLPTAANPPTSTQAAAPVKLFLSHARKDGAAIAASVRQYIRATTSLDSFFDVTNIAFGYDFAEAIEASVENSALVVFQTDEYASRDWCQIEALTAKRHKRPFVVVNVLTKGEKRSFPYLGNVPTIRWYEGSEAAIVAAALEQVLSNLYTNALLKKIAALYGHPERYILAAAPELLDFVEIRRNMREEQEENCVVVYPDPPLGSRELMLLTDSDSRLLFITPTQLPIMNALKNV